jgi:hypothetical protein
MNSGARYLIRARWFGRIENAVLGNPANREGVISLESALPCRTAI